MDLNDIFPELNDMPVDKQRIFLMARNKHIRNSKPALVVKPTSRPALRGKTKIKLEAPISI